MALYDFQEQALRGVVEHLESQKRALLVMATGLGKSRVAAYYAKALIPRGRGLFLCHDNDILEQNLGTFREVLGEDVTLGVFNGRRKDLEVVDVLFASFQTFRRWKNAFFENEFYFIVVDEGHHVEANTFKPVVEYFQPQQLLGMTATPDRMDDRDIRDTFGAEVVSISLEDGIANQWLTSVEYHVLADHTNTSRLRALLRRVKEGDRKVSIKQLNETIFIRRRDEEIAGIITGHNQKAIVFCENIQHADNFAAYLPKAATFHSGNRPDYNDQVLRDFRSGKVQYILVVDKFNEGIDVPDVGLVVFLRCTDSRTVFLQQLGRGLRRVPGKEKVVVLDFVANCERVIMVQQLVEKVAQATKQPFDLDKATLHLEGEGFEFVFSDDVQDILEIVRLVQKKLYIADVPHLLAEYSEKNPLPATEVWVGEYKLLWWKCSKSECGWEWQTAGSNRMRGTGCPACANFVVTERNNLSVTHPDLAKEFHPTKNAPLTAKNFVAGSDREVWWKCSVCEHEWQARIGNRKRGVGCPACSNRVATPTNSLATLYPEVAKEFHPTKNLPYTTQTVTAYSDKKYWWLCSVCGSEWRSSNNSRTRLKTGCHACAGRVVTSTNCLATTHPELAKEFHPTKNAPLTAGKVTAGTNQKLWWKCSVCGHEWYTTGNSRSSGKSGCPICARQSASPENCLAFVYPDLAKEFHPTKNAPLTPQIIIPTKDKKLWWKCSVCGHEWEASARSRAFGQKPCRNCISLSTTHPELAREFHPTRNAPITAKDVVAGTNKKLWWKCSVCGHEWQTAVTGRAQGAGCPVCGRKKAWETRRASRKA